MANIIYKFLKYKKENISIDVRFDLKNNTIWLTQSEIASLFEIKTNSVLFHIKHIQTDERIKPTYEWDSQVQVEGNREIKRKIKLFNLDTIEAISQRSKSKNGYEFIKWAREKLDDIRNTSLTENSPYEAVEQTYLKYYDGEISMDVKLSLIKYGLLKNK